MTNRMTIDLLEDIHGFPTFAVHYKGTRYNFCHLEDVAAFQQRVFNVDNDRLLTQQHKPRHSAKRIVLKVQRTNHELLRNFIVSLVDTHTTITTTEVYEYVYSEFDNQFSYKQTINAISNLIQSGKITSAGRGKYQKVSTDGVARELHYAGEAKEG